MKSKLKSIKEGFEESYDGLNYYLILYSLIKAITLIISKLYVLSILYAEVFIIYFNICVNMIISKFKIIHNNALKIINENN